MAWGKALRTMKCLECDSAITFGDRVLRVIYRDPGYAQVDNHRVTLCAECGILYQESQSYGSEESGIEAGAQQS
jgi:hypothetical protein